ncbi:OB-fold tRNA/helicase-type nucleic acid binding protein [Candidatus Magnetoovum chiemensis]|nr:OB-fold tRNA/helicase-type nucleic acid binding protein [Candidatus Magnetoovum chiemensis]
MANIKMLIITALIISIPSIALSYDVNTEIVIKGKVVEIPDIERGPRQFILEHRGIYYRVFTAPWWYLKRIGLELNVAMNLEILGSKFYGEDGYINIIAYRIKDISTGSTYLFRSEDLKPLWRWKCLTDRRKCP